MKICAACCEELTKESFSKKQWQMKQHQRRCKECIDENCDVKLKAPPKNETAAGIRNPPSLCCAADNEGASCWICLEEGPAELGDPIVRDCSCRGESGFAHLSCIIKYAEQESRRCAERSGVKMVDFTRPWEKCPNCKQLYMKEVALNVATALVTFAKNNYPDNECIHLHALGNKLDVLVRLDQAKESKRIANNIMSIANNILSIVRESKMIHSSPSETVLYIEAYAHDQLGDIYCIEGTKDGAKSAMKHYEICRDIYKAIGSNPDVASAEAKLAQMGGCNNVSIEVELEKCQEVFKQSLELESEESPRRIHIGINMAIHFHKANQAIKAERLLSKIARVSNRFHGPDHELTQLAESSLQYFKARYVYFKTERGLLLFQALRYEDDGENCTVYGPLNSKVWGPGNVPEEETNSFSTKNIIPIEGTPVIYHGLIKSNQLDGKLGDIRYWDEEKTGRYEVHFEDKGLKPCLVKPENIRILFELPDE